MTEIKEISDEKLMELVYNNIGKELDIIDKDFDQKLRIELIHRRGPTAYRVLWMKKNRNE